MEYALSDGAPFFAGGLGVLAADYLLESGKQGINFTAFGLAYQDKNHTLESVGFQKKDSKISLNFSNEIIELSVWEKVFGSAKIYLLDAGELTQSPYGPDYWTMIKQQLILAFGSIKLIKLLNLQPEVFHLNEGHTAFVIWALKQAKMTGKIVATKHTILSESGLFIPREDIEKIYNMCQSEGCPPFEEFFTLASDGNHKNSFSTNKYLLKFAERSSGVSQLHVDFEKRNHPNSPLIPITNGIFSDRWKSNQFDVNNIWAVHSQSKKTLIDFINQKGGFNLDPRLLTVVWARRLVDYKQPMLIFSDLARLSKIVCNANSVQFIIAGSVHTSDPSSMAIAQKINDLTKLSDLCGRIAFHPHNSLSEAQMMVAGADVWLNTPLVGKEACGTSGMKAGLNGALMASTPDGWIPENDWSGLGWMLSGDNTAENLYTALENEIVPLYYSRNDQGIPTEWISRMKGTIKIVEDKYSTARMLTEYWEKLYD